MMLVNIVLVALLNTVSCKRSCKAVQYDTGRSQEQSPPIFEPNFEPNGPKIAKFELSSSYSSKKLTSVRSAKMGFKHRYPEIPSTFTNPFVKVFEQLKEDGGMFQQSTGTETNFKFTIPEESVTIEAKVTAMNASNGNTLQQLIEALKKVVEMSCPVECKSSTKRRLLKWQKTQTDICTFSAPKTSSVTLANSNGEQNPSLKIEFVGAYDGSQDLQDCLYKENIFVKVFQDAKTALEGQNVQSLEHYCGSRLLSSA